MSPQELKTAAEKVKKLLTVDAVKIVGIVAKEHFQEGFERSNQGFTDKTLEHWPDIKEATKVRKRRRNGSLSPILTDSGNLKNSIEWRAGNQEVIMSSDLPYAEVHNEGGGPKNMPKRQFMGPSQELERKAIEIIEQELDKIFGR